MIVEGSKISGEIDETGAVRIYVQTDLKTAETVLDEIKKDKEYEVKFKQHRQKRSLDANAYCWVLCGKIAEKLGSTDKEIYKAAVRDYGLTTIRPEKEELVDELVRMWDSMGLGNSHDILGTSKLKGYVNVKYYYGSSKYDSLRMARLIDGLVQDAKEQGIDTRTPDEIEQMKQQWGTE